MANSRGRRPRSRSSDEDDACVAVKTHGRSGHGAHTLSRTSSSLNNTASDLLKFLARPNAHDHDHSSAQTGKLLAHESECPRPRLPTDARGSSEPTNAQGSPVLMTCSSAISRRLAETRLRSESDKKSLSFRRRASLALMAGGGERFGALSASWPTATRCAMRESK